MEGVFRDVFIRARRSVGPVPTVDVDPDKVGWTYLSFTAYELNAGDELALHTGAYETGIVVLGGHCSVATEDVRFDRIGRRAHVWEKTPPFAVLLPPDTAYRVSAHDRLHLAVAGALAEDEKPLPPRLITPEEIMREDRGEGSTYRQIHHILPPTADSIRLQLVEVYTPATHWSSFPPHKHDTENPPHEAYLEETYYYQIHPEEGFAFQRVYTDDGTLDEACAPSNGDLVVVPKGYHPVAAMPGYDCYYLNAMAGPEKQWNFTVDPKYAWLMNWKKPAAWD